MNKTDLYRCFLRCFSRRCAVALGAAALLAIASAHAQTMESRAAETITPDIVAQRYPAGSIRSVETADRALSDVEAGRLHVEAGYASAERECFPKFFMNHCLNEAKEERRALLARLRDVEVEANAFKRKTKAEGRDRVLAERRAEEQADELRREQVQKERLERQAERERKLAGPQAGTAREPKAPRTADAVKNDDRPVRQRSRKQPTPAEEAEDARKRQANIAAYEKKVRDAEARQREVAARKLEKERERAAKAAEKERERTGTTGSAAKP